MAARRRAFSASVAAVLLIGFGSADAGEKEALEFAKANSPQLSRLLDRLRKSSPEQYEEAVAEIDEDRVRLERIAIRSKERHALELERWKLDSRGQILSAEYAVRLLRLESAKAAAARSAARPGDDGSQSVGNRRAAHAVREAETRLKATEKAIDSLAGQRLKFDVRRLEFEADAAEKNLQRIREELVRLETDPEGERKKRINRMVRSGKAAARARSQSESPKNGNKTPGSGVE